VKVGGRYRVGGSVLEIDAITQIPAREITDVDAHRAGEPDRGAVLKRLGDLADDATVFRIDFHRVGDAGPLHPLALEGDLSADELADLARRLARLDRTRGPWTLAILRVIASMPAIVSTDLAAVVGQERPEFKLNVRKLKALGLTESLERGYRLTPRGAAVLRHLEGDR
jgi:hypothetical protein